MNTKITYLSWLISTTSTIGSLYFSNVMMLPPCLLCWWQRICMYPLVVLFSIAYIRKDQNSIFYTAPLIAIGLVISIYHNFLYYGLIEKSIVPCTSDVSCTSITIEWAGFITIPLLAWFAFTLLFILSICSLLNLRNSNEKK
jgi:disulfide bond formation protein DsbB